MQTNFLYAVTDTAFHAAPTRRVTKAEWLRRPTPRLLLRASRVAPAQAAASERARAEARSRPPTSPAKADKAMASSPDRQARDFEGHAAGEQDISVRPRSRLSASRASSTHSVR